MPVDLLLRDTAVQGELVVEALSAILALLELGEEVAHVP